MKKSFLLSSILFFSIFFCFGQEFDAAIEAAANYGIRTVTDNKMKKEVIVYFASWNLGNESSDHQGEVAGLPWRYASCINHAFWEIRPADGSTESSFERRASGLGARTEFEVVSTYPQADFEDSTTSKYETGLQRNHFSEYEFFSRRYPDVKILLSIGGWTRSGYFSEMAFTKEGRASCIGSIIQVLQTYPWLSGIDIDWEYPGASIDGERKADGDNQGCPIFGTVKDDKVNFAAFLKELREAMDSEFGAGTKRLTACAGASVSKVLPCQDWKAAEPYLDFINVMTYDMASPAAGKVGHNSSMSDIRTTIKYLERRGVPKEKMTIGSPLYGVAFKMKKIPTSDFIGTECETTSPSSVEINQDMILEFESQLLGKSKTGWHKVYDTTLGGTYLYNDSTSKYGKWFISYESEESLNEKLEYIIQSGLAGIMVWESTIDNREHKIIRTMSNTFRTK